MRKDFSRIMVVAALLIKAATVVIPNYSHQLLIMALVPLVLLSIILYLGRERAITTQLPWIIAVSSFIFFVLPKGFGVLMNLDQLTDTLESVLRGVLETEYSPILLVVLVASWLLFRNKALFLPILIRYAALYFLLHNIRVEVFSHAELYRNLINVILVTGLVRDLGGYNHGYYISSIARCALLSVFFLLIGRMGRWHGVPWEIEALFELDAENWLTTVLVVFGMGLLILYNEWQLVEKNNLNLFRDHHTGLILLIWCLLALIMNTMKVFYNKDILLIGFPLLSAMADGMMCAYDSKKTDQWASKFALIWACMGIVVLMLAKSLNMGLLLTYILIAALLFIWLFWKKFITGKFRIGKISAMVGIAAILVLIFAGMTSVEQLEAMPQMLLGALAACIMWYVLCRHTITLNANSSGAYPAEFELTGHVRTAVAGLLLVLTVIRVLFVI